MMAERKAAPAAEKARSPIPNWSELNGFCGGGGREEHSLEPVPSPLISIAVWSEAIHEFWIRSESAILVFSMQRPKKTQMVMCFFLLIEINDY